MLGNADFRRLWLGETASRFGTSVTSLVLPLLAVTQLGASSFEVGVLTAAAYLPWVLISLHAGVWVDRLRNARSCCPATASPACCSSACRPPRGSVYSRCRTC